MKNMISWLAILFGATFSLSTSAQITYDGCKDFRGIPVASISDFSINDVAIASLTPSGAPIIRYNKNVLAWMAPETRLFFYAHECGHHARGHAFGTVHPLAMEQDADCFAIRTLTDLKMLDGKGIAVVQNDIARAGKADWTHLPGPQRAINLQGCLTATPAKNPTPAPLACCDSYGIRRCQITVNPGPLGSACYCNGVYGFGRTCQ